MSTPAQMSIAGMFTGGAAIPMIAPMDMIAPAFSLGMPMRRRTGATSAPVLRTAAVEDPVIIPGNMTVAVRRKSIRTGTFLKRFTIAVFSASRAPDSFITVMKIMAQEIVIIVSRYAKAPSARCLSGMPCPPAIAPATAPIIMEMLTGSLRRRLASRNAASMIRRHTKPMSMTENSISPVPNADNRC